MSQSSDGSLSPSSDAGSDIFEARNFAFADLVAATENFRDGNFVGEGGFGPVYKGRLPGGKVYQVMQQCVHLLHLLCLHIHYVCCIVNADCGY